jgi:Type II CAAX prenyl endopeptidase Rce1-like
LSDYPKERGSGLAIIPILLTFGYSVWTPFPRASVWTAMIPQVSGYLCLIAWSVINGHASSRLWIVNRNLRISLIYGGLTGILTGMFNLWVIVKLTPMLGYSFDFLRSTPHARMPFWLMVPWGIVGIAVFVEINFRGYLLGRLLVLLGDRVYAPTAAVLLSALVFSLDPYMTSVFRGYHWLALSDGVVWGVLLLRTRNLFSTITAHAVEVILVYTVLRIFYA